MYPPNVADALDVDRAMRPAGTSRRAGESTVRARTTAGPMFPAGGHSQAIAAAMLTVAGPCEQLIIDRNASPSLVQAVIVSGVEPVWVGPFWDAQAQLPCPPDPAAVQRALDREPGARGVLLCSPTRYGTCADLAAIAAMCHDRDRVLVVDEAGAAHLPFHPDLPPAAVPAGADLAVTCGYPTGEIVHHVGGDRIDRALLRRRAELFGAENATDSSSDGWWRRMSDRGAELLDRALRLARQVRIGVVQTPGIAALDRELIGAGRAADADPLCIVVDVSGLGVGGIAAADWLRERAGVDVAFADHRRIVARVAWAAGDGVAGGGMDGGADGGARTLLAGLRRLASAGSEALAGGEAPVGGEAASGDVATARGGAVSLPVDVPDPSGLAPEVVMLPRDAYFGHAAAVPVRRAAGRVAAETITPYPPGIPAILPGELIGEAVLDYLRAGVESSAMRLPDASDPRLETVRVVCA